MNRRIPSWIAMAASGVLVAASALAQTQGSAGSENSKPGGTNAANVQPETLADELVKRCEEPLILTVAAETSNELPEKARRLERAVLVAHQATVVGRHRGDQCAIVGRQHRVAVFGPPRCQH